MIFLLVTHEWHEKFVQKLVCHTSVNVKFKLSCTVIASMLNPTISSVPFMIVPFIAPFCSFHVVWMPNGQ